MRRTLPGFAEGAALSSRQLPNINFDERLL